MKLVMYQWPQVNHPCFSTAVLACVGRIIRGHSSIWRKRKNGVSSKKNERANCLRYVAIRAIQTIPGSAVRFGLERVGVRVMVKTTMKIDCVYSLVMQERELYEMSATQKFLEANEFKAEGTVRLESQQF